MVCLLDYSSFEYFHSNMQDVYFKNICNAIMQDGFFDENPRPKWADGTPAYTKSINHVACTYDLSKNQWPMITLRPIAVKKAIGEILWIYQDESNDLDVLKEKYGVTWWDDWEIPDNIPSLGAWSIEEDYKPRRTIGSCYGGTVHKHNLMKNLIDDIKKDPYGRRHIINLWQEDDFKEPHGLKPCAFQTIWNVRGEYLDMCLIQRSSDYITAGSINQMQYAVFLKLVATSLGYKAGKFTWMCANVQIYDRHMDFAEELMNRDSISCEIEVDINKKKWGEYALDDITIKGYPREEISKINPNTKLEVAV